MRKHLTLALSFLGLFDSIYLWWVYTSPSRPLVCMGTGCDVVRASSYAHVWGVPLPLFGVLMYGIIAILTVAETLAGPFAGLIRYGLLTVSSAGFLVSLGLTGIEAFVIHAYCEWCLLSAMTVTLIFALAIRGILRPPVELDGLAALATIRRQFGLFILALLIAIPSFIHLARSGEIPPVKVSADAILNQHLIRPDSNMTGNLNSPVTVVEFGDFECPACGSAEPVVEQMLSQRGNRVRFVFRQFPLVAVHSNAEKAAEASLCAAHQGKFWQAYSFLYQHQEDLTEQGLERDAASLGLNTAEFDQCLESGQEAARVQRDIVDAHALGLHATPVFFVNRHVIQGPPTLAELTDLIDQELSKSGTSAAPANAAAPAPGGNTQGDTPPQPGPNPLDPASSATPASGEGLGSGATVAFAGRGTGVFGQLQQQNTLACSEDEANRQQPALIHTPEAHQLFASIPKPVFVDVRAPEVFAAGHIPGAVDIPAAQIGQQTEKLPKDRVIVLYQGGHRGASPGDICAFSRAAGRILLAKGFSWNNVKVYQEGFADWQKAGYPVER
jgi:rhodanese-related sulfurtransferase/uncharacterized membrane protein/predicted DsbA family dithiol-disulfide isomerase